MQDSQQQQRQRLQAQILHALQSGEVESARVLLSQAMKLGAPSGDLMALAGEVFMAGGQKMEAAQSYHASAVLLHQELKHSSATRVQIFSNLEHAVELAADNNALLASIVPDYAELCRHYGKYRRAEELALTWHERQKTPQTALFLAQCHILAGSLRSAATLLIGLIDDGIASQEIYEELALALEGLGDRVMAQEFTDRGLALYPSSHRLKIVASQLALKRGELEAAETWLEGVETDAATEHLQARIAEKRGNYDAAYEHYTQSKTHIDQHVDDTALRRMLEVSLGGFTKEMIAPPDHEFSPISKGHAFLIGWPRSGTTLLEQMFSVREDVLVTDESPALAQTWQHMPTAMQNPQAAYPVCLRDIQPEQVDELRRFYASRLEGLTEFDGFLFDKMPLNMKFMPLMNKFFPDAHIVTLIRDPRDAVISCFRQRFRMNPDMVWMRSLEDIVTAYDMTFTLWQQLQPMLSVPHIQLRYEDLLDAPELELKALCGSLGLAFDDAMLKFYEADKKRDVTTPSADAITQPLNRDAVGSWKNYEAYLKPHMTVLDTWVKAFGYS